MPAKKRRAILVTGATGLLGKGLEETAGSRDRLIGLHQRDYKVEGSPTKHLVLDIRDKRRLDALFERHRFEAVVHAAGIASVDYVEKNYAESLESNLVGTLNVTSACRRFGSYLVYISTNAVFDGLKPPYRESDPVNPVNKYGRIKLECERLVRETLKDYSILRPILMYGWNHLVCRPNPATWIFEKLLRGEAVEMVDDVYENPLYNRQCAQLLWQVLRRRPSGVIHAAGKESLNRYEFALKVARVFGLDASLIKRVDSSRFPGIARRPPNTTFLTQRMRHEFGVEPLDVEQGLRLMKQAMKARA